MQGVTKLITTFSAYVTTLKLMLVEFTTNLGNSSKLGCPMFFKKGLKKFNMPKNGGFCDFFFKQGDIDCQKKYRLKKVVEPKITKFNLTF